MRHQDETYSRKFKFEQEQASFNQCIPNPFIEKQFITVQIASNLLKPAERLTPLSKFPEVERQQGRLYQNYEFIKDKPNMYGQDTKLFPAVREATFSENPLKDQKGIKVQHYMKTKLSEHKEEEYAAKIAIIAFWRLEEKNEFKCYRCFKVPNPITREVLNDQELLERKNHNIHDMLFVGEKEVFFFYHQQDEFESAKMTDSVMLGRIHYNPKSSGKDYSSDEISKSSEL